MGIIYKRTANNPPDPAPIDFVPKILDEKLGRGLIVPLELQADNTWRNLSGVDKVEQDMLVCLTTPVNRRLGQADYGSELPYLLFEPWDSRVRRELVRATRGSLESWVPQIIVHETTVDIMPSHVVLIVVEYSIKGTAAFNIFQIALTSDDSVQLPSGTFTIDGRRFLPGITRG